VTECVPARASRTQCAAVMGCTSHAHAPTTKVCSAPAEVSASATKMTASTTEMASSATSAEVAATTSVPTAAMSSTPAGEGHGGKTCKCDNHRNSKEYLSTTHDVPPWRLDLN
jgi:hypothetical protein